jgi:hypothetical protein
MEKNGNPDFQSNSFSHFLWSVCASCRRPHLLSFVALASHPAQSIKQLSLYLLFGSESSILLGSCSSLSFHSTVS